MPLASMLQAAAPKAKKVGGPRKAAATNAVACPRPLHPKLAQRSYLPEFVKTAAEVVLGGSQLETLITGRGLHANTTRVISVGTACSGSELYMLSLPLLANVLKDKTGREVIFQHEWGCELNPQNRAWV